MTLMKKLETGDKVKITSGKHTVASVHKTFETPKDVRIVGVHADIENVSVMDENDVLFSVKRSEIIR